MTQISAGSLADRRLYLCTPDRPDLEDFVGSCIGGGVDIVQLRDKNLEARAVLDRAALVRDICRTTGVPFILNDRPDLALEVGADGVHVGQDDAPPDLARKILGSDAIIGFSTHSPDQFGKALNEPVDYLSAGPVVPTPTKPGRPGTGIEYVTSALEQSRAHESRGRRALPFFITGGVTPESVPILIRAGGRHFVVVRYLTESDRPERSARVLLDAITSAIEQIESLQS